MNAHDAKSIAALDELFHEVGTYRTSRDFGELFNFIKKFPQLAPYNAFLIHVQKPGSRYVASVLEWQLRFNRRIRPGARPLVILHPFGPVHFVFELGDTDGPDPFPEDLLRPFRRCGPLSASTLKLLRANLPRVGVAYHESDYGTGSGGWIGRVQAPCTQNSGSARVRVLYDLVVNSNLSPEEQFGIIIHELGHLYCGHLGKSDTGGWPDRSGLDEDVREFEAESVAWLVCERIGLDNPSAAYLSHYLRDNDMIPPVSLEQILKATRVVERMISRRLSLRKALVVND